MRISFKLILKVIKSGSKYSILKYVNIILLVSVPLLLVSIVDLVIYNNIQICFIKNIFNKECFGCGMTRSTFYFYKGDFYNAYFQNRLSVIVFPFLLLIWIFYIKNAISNLKEEKIKR